MREEAEEERAEVVLTTNDHPTLCSGLRVLGWNLFKNRSATKDWW